MSTVETNLAPPAHNGDQAHAHDPHLAHHFDSPEQQFDSAKLGMWVFLGTEILMFGGLFCAYSVYRHNHPDVFAFAHKALDRPLGAVNTIVLITSSLTMAWAVRAAQLGGARLSRILMMLTLLGGFGFLGIKAIEYHTKWHHELFFGSTNAYYGWDGTTPMQDHVSGEHAENGAPESAEHNTPNENASDKKPVPGAAPTIVNATESPKAPSEPANPAANVVLPPGGAIDANAGTPDQAKIVANWADPSGLSEKLKGQEVSGEVSQKDLAVRDRKNIYTFFAVYFFMTGLHGLHVVIGMGLIYWVLLRSAGPRRRLWLVPAAPISIGLFLAYLGIVVGGSLFWMSLGIGIAVLGTLWAVANSAIRGKRTPNDEGEFGPNYFTPVDLVGLYWHLVDLIWIFLFPLLYLIH